VNQAIPAWTRQEALKNDYATGSLDDAMFEWVTEALLRLGIADDSCPYTPEHGFEWYQGIPFPREFLR
jgi:hypothetical protein